MEKRLTAFFASRRCPGSAIRAAIDWALLMARGGTPIISGFHSPLECSVLDVLLQARSPAVVVLARPVESARLRVGWETAIDEGHLVIVSAATGTRQLHTDQALARNELVACLASGIVIAHVSQGGCLETQKENWSARGISVRMVSDELSHQV